MEYAVSIRCYTYNQEKYIAQTLEGFVSQRTDFPFIILLVDDASTDSNVSAIKNFINNNFIIGRVISENEDAIINYAIHKDNNNCHIAFVELKENHYSKNKDKLQYLKEWRENAKYEAFCEGDDFWIDSNKLQRQVDYMESHPECGLCYTDCDIYYETENRWEHSIYENGIQERFDNNNPMLPRNGWYTSNVTWVWRLSVYNKISQEHSYYDRPLYTLLNFCLLSDVAYLPFSSGVYRRYVGSVSYDEDERKKWNYYRNSFFLFTDYIPKFPNPKEVKRLFLDNRLFSTYLSALKYEDNEVLDCFKNFYPKYFFNIFSPENISKRGWTVFDRLIWKCLLAYRKIADVIHYFSI